MIFVIIVASLIFIFAFNQWLYLRKAHSTFENYYAFRGCMKLIERKDTFGVCKVKNGGTIKIVKYQNKWYLDGDLPWACIGNMCFGF
jgi:hypothetical protein